MCAAKSIDHRHNNTRGIQEIRLPSNWLSPAMQLADTPLQSLQSSNSIYFAFFPFCILAKLVTESGILGHVIWNALWANDAQYKPAKSACDHNTVLTQRSRLVENIYELLPKRFTANFRSHYYENAPVYGYDVCMGRDELLAAVVGSSASDQTTRTKKSNRLGPIWNRHWWLGVRFLKICSNGKIKLSSFVLTKFIFHAIFRRMTDEANVHVYAMVDQLIEGHQWLNDNLNYTPITGFSIDPFGHGSTLPYLLAASDFKGTIIQRIHYAWKQFFARHQYGRLKRLNFAPRKSFFPITMNSIYRWLLLATVLASRKWSC